MTLSIGSVAPDFTAETTQGTINFHDWIGDHWAILFSHPKAFTPVCTTELGYMAGLEGEFAKRDTKIIGLSVDTAEDNRRWLPDIEEVSGNIVDYPVIGDSDLNVAGAIRLARELGPGHAIVTMLCDPGTRYQSRLFNPEFLRSKGLTPPEWLDRPTAVEPDFVPVPAGV